MLHALPLWYAAAALGVASLGLKAACGISAEQSGRRLLKRSIELTLGIHALGCVAIIVAVLSERALQ
jgi:hypothetical protein